MQPITSYLPKEMLPLNAQPAIYYAIQEALYLGINDFCIVMSKWKKMLKVYLLKTFPELKFTFINQKEQKGLGHAILCGKKWAKNDSFLLIMPDNFFDDFAFMKRFINAYHSGCLLLTFKGADADMNKYAVLETKTPQLEYAKIQRIYEKPKPSETRSRQMGYWRAIISPEIFAIINQLEPGKNNEIQLTDAFNQIAKNGNLYAFNSTVKHQHLKFFDIGNKKDYAATNDFFTNLPSPKTKQR